MSAWSWRAPTQPPPGIVSRGFTDDEAQGCPPEGFRRTLGGHSDGWGCPIAGSRRRIFVP